MKKIILTLSLLFLAGLIFSQDSQVPSDTVKNWKIGGQVGLAFTQVSLTNWAAGGENALSASGLLRLGAEYKKNQTSWDNYLLAGYGILKQGDREVQKNDDRLEILSKYGRKAGKSWYYSAQFNFRSQFAPGYKDPVERTEKISDWLSPGYITFSLGMDYKPNDNFSLFLSPVTSKITFSLGMDYKLIINF